MVQKIIIEKTYVVGTHWNCLTEAIPQSHCVPTTYVAENKGEKNGNLLFGNLFGEATTFTNNRLGFIEYSHVN